MGRLIDADKLIEYWLTPPMSVGWDDVIEDVNNQPTVEAIPKDQYESRLKADMVTILTELQLEIENLYPEHQCTGELTGFADAIETITPIVQHEIDKLKGEKR